MVGERRYHVQHLRNNVLVVYPDGDGDWGGGDYGREEMMTFRDFIYALWWRLTHPLATDEMQELEARRHAREILERERVYGE